MAAPEPPIQLFGQDSSWMAGSRPAMEKPGVSTGLFLRDRGSQVFNYAAFLVSMPSTRLTAVGSSVFSTAATSRAMRASAFS